MAGVLIPTCSEDWYRCVPVAEELERLGARVVPMLVDGITVGANNFSVGIDQGGILAEYDGTDIMGVSAAWLRRPFSWSLHDLDSTSSRDKLHAKGLMREVETSIQDVLNLLPDNIWLNSPSQTKRAALKLSQLGLASSLGLIIPRTITTNSAARAKDKMRSSSEIAVKMHFGCVETLEETLTMYTRCLPFDVLGMCEESGSSLFPLIVQEFQQKKKEWRVTIVGQEVFSAAIYTSADAKDDWRRHPSGGVRFVKEQFPDAESDLCINLLGKLGLQYGTFDFIETPEGEIIFLEVNPSGNYLWLEEQLGLPISNSIASKLVEIARSNQQ